MKTVQLVGVTDGSTPHAVYEAAVERSREALARAEEEATKRRDLYRQALLALYDVQGLGGCDDALWIRALLAGDQDSIGRLYVRMHSSYVRSEVARHSALLAELPPEPATETARGWPGVVVEDAQER